MTLVKICGITNLDDAVVAIDAGADLLGFHFCPSRRRITPDEAAHIVRSLPRRPQIVGVFIDASEDEADSIAEFCELDLLQLHGTEAPGFRSRAPIMKALKVRDGRVPDARDWPDPVLLDSWSPDERGGTGRSWDWENAKALIQERHVFVAGGLTPENVGAVVDAVRPHGVDVSSGVEAEVRHKDPEKVRRFIAEVRGADGGTR